MQTAMTRPGKEHLKSNSALQVEMKTAMTRTGKEQLKSNSALQVEMKTAMALAGNEQLNVTSGNEDCNDSTRERVNPNKQKR